MQRARALAFQLIGYCEAAEGFVAPMEYEVRLRELAKQLKEQLETDEIL